MKNLIVTADDFGVFPSINEGIKAAVLAGKVNSVASISNHSDSVKNVKELISAVGNKAEIGCHLTISSGQPLVANGHDAFTDGKYFRGFDALKITKLEKNTDLLEKELKAQVQVFLDSGITVTNLSCHHSTLTNTKPLFDTYLKVARDFNLPIRSPNITPPGKDNTYRMILQMLLVNNIPVSKSREMRRFGNEIEAYSKNSGIKTPSILESRHYGPPPFFDILAVRIKALIKGKHNSLTDFMEEFLAHENYSHAELMLHLVKDDIYLYEQDDGIDYPGINQKYFDSRNIEFLSINSYDFAKYFDRIKLSSWREL